MFRGKTINRKLWSVKILKEFFEKHKEKIIILLLCGVLFIIVLSILALISGAIMKVFGFEYRSIGSIVLFFIIATISSYPLGLIASTFPKALLSLNKVSMPTAIALYLILDTFATFWGLRITDYCMQTISAKDISIFVISLIFALLGVGDIKKILHNEER